jgi:hypothetical protein
LTKITVQEKLGRFYSCVLDEDHLLAASAYVELNPVRAGMPRWPDRNDPERKQKEGLERVLFLDRDGVINEDREDYVKSWEEFRFIKGARPALKKIKEAGIPVVVLTNQSAIGRGLISEGTLLALHDRMTAGI